LSQDIVDHFGSPMSSRDQARVLVAESIFRRSSFLDWWRRSASVDVRSPQWTDGMTESKELATDQLIRILDEAAQMGQQVADEVSATHGAQPTANAASICRWKLLKLRDRLTAVESAGRLRAVRDETQRHLEAAASAAQSMSYGYRLHNLDRICDGGQALDDHLGALARIRSRLAPQP
jgi:hypothetical protein